jgi:hypothetical protein
VIGKKPFDQDNPVFLVGVDHVLRNERVWHVSLLVLASFKGQQSLLFKSYLSK